MRRNGYWKKGGYACGETEWKCSVCGETEWRTSCSRMKFCLFCGAKMDTHDPEKCAYFSAGKCLGTKESDQCKREGCEKWKGAKNEKD